MGKKGISPIIASVLIITLTIAGIAIIAGFIIPFVRESLGGATECLPYQTYFSFDETFGFNCFEGGEIKLSIRANPLQREASELNEFRVVFIGEAGSESVTVKDGAPPGEVVLLDAEGDNLKVPGIGEVRTYVYSGGTNFKSMEVYPVLESGRICEVSDSINLRVCL